jgi:hypothetical protein
VKKQSKKYEYETGPKAKKDFEDLMKNLFRAQKSDSKKAKKGKD